MRKPSMVLPCKMRLDEMTNNENGYHCSNCDKVLTDFREKTNDEIVQLIQSYPGKVCGVFHPNQFDYKTTRFSVPAFSSGIGISLLGILGFLGPVLTSCETHSQDSEPIRQKAFNTLKFPMHIKGTLRDEKTQNPLPHALLQIRQNGTTILSAYADEKGVFDLLLHKEDLVSEQFDLVYSASGHVADTLKQAAVTKFAKNQRLSLTLKAEAGNCVKSVEINDRIVNGEPTVEGMMLVEPTSGVPAIEIVEPPAEIIELPFVGVPVRNDEKQNEADFETKEQRKWYKRKRK